MQALSSPLGGVAGGCRCTANAGYAASACRMVRACCQLQSRSQLLQWEAPASSTLQATSCRAAR